VNKLQRGFVVNKIMKMEEETAQQKSKEDGAGVNGKLNG